MKKASVVLSLPVVGIKEGNKIGVTQNLIINPETKCVEYLVFNERKDDIASLLSFSCVVGIGRDFLVIGSEKDIQKAYENKALATAMENGFSLMGITVVSDEGDILGKIVDYDIDEKSGGIMSISIDNEMDFAEKFILSMTKNMVFVSREGLGKEPATQNSFEDESKRYLLGKTLTDNVENDAGECVYAKGTVLTAELINEAEAKDMLVQLTLNVD